MGRRSERRSYVVIERKGRILLVRNRAGNWTLPGGRARVGEPLRVAARREVKEETGLHVKVRDRVSGRHVRFHRGDCERCVVYVGRIRRNGEPRPRAEISEIKWVPIGKVPARLTNFRRSRIRKALERL